jgi:hypothetical protein
LGSKALSHCAGVVDIRIRDISLERLYNVLFNYCCIYSNYSFNIIRYSKYYLLVFKAWEAV